MSQAPSRPSGVRHLIILLLTLMSVLLYLDRFCVSFAGDYIREDLGLTQTHMSWVLSSFFWSYALSQVPAGWLADRFGARLMLSIYVVGWSLFTAQLGIVHGLAMLLFARLLCGITQAGAYPTAGGVISRWIPLSKRATASAWVGLGGRLGGALSTSLTAILMILFVPVGSRVELTDADILDAERLCARVRQISPETQMRLASTVRTAVDSEFPLRQSTETSLLARLRLRIWIFCWSDRLSKMLDQEWLTNRSPNEIAEAVAKMIEGDEQSDGKVTRLFGAGPQRVIQALSLPEATRLAISQVADDVQVREINDLVGKHELAWSPRNDLAAKSEKRKLPPEHRTQLVELLNQLLSRSDLFESNAFARVNLPDEGVRYAKRIQANENLSSAELKRFNRLLLEATFPGEIRKLYGRGWRPVMMVYGLSGVIVAVAIWLVFRNRPEEHWLVNPKERAVIEVGRLATAADTASKAGRLPIKPLLTNFGLWCNCANQIGTNVGWIFLMTWLSRYFIEMHNVPILERSFLVMLPGLIGMCGGFLGGRWVDWLLPRIGLKWSRSLPPIITRFMGAAGYGMCLYFASQPVGSTLNSPWAFTAAFCLIYFSVDLGQSAFWAYAQDAGGKYVGSILGWGNMWGNLGAAFAPLVYNYLLGETPGVAEWNNLFWLGLFAFVFAGLATFGLDASKPIFDETKDSLTRSVSEGERST